MVVTADGIYDAGGKWIFGGDGKSFVQILPDANIDAIRYVADNTSGYAWDDRSLGIRPAPQQMQHVLEFPGCISCAAGFSYSLNTVDMRTPSQIAADQRAFTLGVASLAGLPISGAGLLASYGVRPLLTGAGLGSGFDGVGQVIGGGEYRPGQTLVAGVTGALAYPLAGGGVLANALLGASVGATNATANNYVYSENKNIGEAAVIGAFAGSLGAVAGKNMSDMAASILPYRIGSSIIDPNKAILLQNIGVKNPYPNYIGGFSESLVGEGVPILFDKLKSDEE